jgi:LmbE family N-acetylglucosaminyl deacetylase
MVSIDYKNARVLAVGAHADDIELGCAGFLSRFKFKPILAVAACGKNDIRSRESMLSCKVLKATFRPMMLQDKNLDIVLLIQKIETLISDIKPTIILTHSTNDSHQDHRTVNKAVISAVRNKNCTVLFFKSPSTLDFKPNVFVELSKQNINTKLRALKEHSTQAHRRFIEPTIVKSVARYWGTTYRSNNEYCEPFELFRMVINDIQE